MHRKPTVIAGWRQTFIQSAWLVTEQRNSHLEATVEDLRARLNEMKAERDQAMQDAREDRARVVALLEYQRPESLWSKLFR